MKISRKIIPYLMILITALVSIGCSDDDTPPVTYTVAFNSQFIYDPGPNPATTVMPNPTSITVEEGDTVGTLPTNPSMSGYKFSGWWTGKNGTGAQFTQETVVESDIIVYAYWVKYKVTFISDGATYAERGVTPPAKTSSFPTSPTKTGFNFAGWYTQQNGSGTQFTASTEVTADITVYAYWTTSTVHVVTFNSDGGTEVGIRYVISPATTVGSNWPDDPTRPFYHFDGWAINCDPDGCTPFIATTVVNNNIMVYAQWTSTPGYTVIFNSYGGTSVGNQYVVPPATNVGTLPADPAKRCYAFDAWYTEPNGGGTAFTAATTVNATNTTAEGTITVYAHWDWAYIAATPPFAIGDFGPSCVGKVFYITDGGLHGLEAAPPNWYEGEESASEGNAAWIYGGTATDENGEEYQETQSTENENTSTDIGTGLANSNAIVTQVEQAGGTTTPYAAKLCLDYSVGDGGNVYSDWYLPSKDELALLYANRDVTSSGGFADEGYWSSSEYGQWDAWSQYFSNGQETGTYKSQGRMVRPIRYF